MTEETIPQMRDTIERLQKDLKSTASEKDKLATENRQLTARELAREAQLDPKYGELFAKTAEGDLTVDGITEFAQEFGLPAAETEGSDAGGDGYSGEAEGSEASTPGSADLSKMARGGSSAGEGAGSATEETMTRAEWTELSRTDPAAAQAALAKGQVQISRNNPYAGNTQRPGNPFGS